MFSVEHPIFSSVPRLDAGILGVHVPDRALQRSDRSCRVHTLPNQVRRIKVRPDLRTGGFAQAKQCFRVSGDLRHYFCLRHYFWRGARSQTLRPIKANNKTGPLLQERLLRQTTLCLPIWAIQTGHTM